MDYWVNDQQGTPFFVVTAIGTEGMIHHLRTTIIPRLLQEVPAQPSQAELQADEKLHRFVVVFDREGWSPLFFAELWRDHRIAVITYRKGNIEAWADNEFEEKNVPTVFGNTTKMDLAERPFSHKSCEATKTKPAVALREIRRSCDNKSHQTSIITTLMSGEMGVLAGHMFARWSQENFFKYATKELGIDHFPGYELSEPPENERIKNPDYVILDAALRRNLAKKKKIEAKCASLLLDSNDSKAVATYLEKRGVLDQQLGELNEARKVLLAERRDTAKHIKLADLPEDKRPRLIALARTQFLNTIRILAYRAETALVSIIRETISRHDDARALAKSLFTHDADLIFYPDSQILKVRLHHFTNPQSSNTISSLLSVLNQAKINFPGTEIRMSYEMVSDPNPTSHDL